MATSRVTAILERLRDGQTGAESELYARVYDDLKGKAQAFLRKEFGNPSLQATSLVHEAYIRLRGHQFENSAQFYAFAAIAMRRILVEHARSQLTLKRGNRPARQPLDSVERAVIVDYVQLLALDEAMTLLRRRAEEEPSAGKKEILARRHEVVELRFFSGLDFAEIAQTVGRSEKQIRRDWDRGSHFLEACIVEGRVPDVDEERDASA